MNKLLLVFLLWFGISSCYDPILIKKYELSEILKTLFDSSVTRNKYYLIDSIQEFDTKSFTLDSTEYFFARCDELNGRFWNNSIIDNVETVTTRHLDSLSRPDPLTLTPEHYRFSFPFFAKDKKSFVIYYNHYCGILCAESAIRLYRKENGSWKLVKSFLANCKLREKTATNNGFGNIAALRISIDRYIAAQRHVQLTNKAQL